MMLLRYCLLLFAMLPVVSVQAEDATDAYDRWVLEEEFQVHEPLGHRFFSPIASLLVPGVGQMLNKEVTKGFMHLGAFTLFTWQKNEYRVGDEFDREKAYFERDDESVIYINKDKLFRDFYSVLQRNTALYSSFDAYRVATLSRDTLFAGDIPVSRESLKDLSLAPFTLKYLVEPYVFVPLTVAGMYLLGRGSRNREEQDQPYYRYKDDVNQGMLIGTNLVKHEFVSVGEETFFRGYVNTEAVRQLGLVPGIITSSLIFGSVHTGTGASANATVATGYGLYLGFVHFKQRGQLGYNIALHYWWNIAVALSVIDRSKEVRVPVFEMTF